MISDPSTGRLNLQCKKFFFSLLLKMYSQSQFLWNFLCIRHSNVWAGFSSDVCLHFLLKWKANRTRRNWARPSQPVKKGGLVSSAFEALLWWCEAAESQSQDLLQGSFVPKQCWHGSGDLLKLCHDFRVVSGCWLPGEKVALCQCVLVAKIINLRQRWLTKINVL